MDKPYEIQPQPFPQNNKGYYQGSADSEVEVMNLSESEQNYFVSVSPKDNLKIYQSNNESTEM